MKKFHLAPVVARNIGAAAAATTTVRLRRTPAEALMRSRYSAYVLKLEPYLLATWHPSTRPPALDLAANNAKWIGLQVKKFVQQSADRSTVEFVARCRIGGRAQRLHEISRFVREDGRWYYVDGEFPD